MQESPDGCNISRSYIQLLSTITFLSEFEHPLIEVGDFELIGTLSINES